MHITVKLFATFRTGRFKETSKECSTGTVIRTILDELAIPVDEVGVLLVNARHAEPDRPLADGDTLSVFPLVGGG
jgi:molybdopterin converting factor small subunit